MLAEAENQNVAAAGAGGRPFNALEQLLIPRLPGEAGGQQALEERAREDAVRLMRFRGQRR